MSLGWPEDLNWADPLLSVAATAFSPDNPGVVGVAVSGGGDSMAALHLMARVAPHRGWQVRAVTVDHRLRPGAADEAAFVGRVCAGLGVSHDVVVWTHGAVAGNLMDQARRARYRLIGDWARGCGVGHVVLGHTADDQAETFLMGLSRGAGLDGLSGMRRDWAQGGVTFLRPFLRHARGALRAYLLRNGLEWVDDPTNDDDRFARTKARRALAALKPLGITAETLGGVVLNLSSAQRAMVAAASDAFRSIGRTEAGTVILDREPFCALTPEIHRRLLIAALKWVSGADHAPRQGALLRVQTALRAARHTTLSGCRILVSDAAVRIVREPRAVAGVVCATDALWDGRWRLAGPHAPDLTLRALGADGLRACPDWRGTGLSREALLVSPAVWRGEVLVAGPLAGKADGWGATVAAAFSLSAVSH